jgi:hypothetical protein
MQTIQGKVIQVKINTTVPYAPTSGKTGGYLGYQVIYTDARDGTVKTLSKAMASLKFTPAIRDVLESLKPDDDFTVVQEKVGNFLEVRSIAKGIDENAAFSAAVAAEVPPAPGYKSPTPVRPTGNTYETPEERKLKQRLIVRQSALNQAIDFHQGNGNLTEIKETAEVIEEWVYRGLD